MNGERSRRLTLSAWKQVDAICDEFEKAWRNGGCPRAEDFLQPFDEPARTRLLRELILVEVDYRRDAGENPLQSEYAERFPERPEAVGQAFDNSLPDTVLVSNFEVAPEDTVRPTILMPSGVEDPLPGTTGPDGEATSRRAKAQANIGRVIGMYRLEKWLGGGGMGDVYRATHTAIHSERAVKLMCEKLAHDEQAIKRLFLEAQASITHLSHLNIAKTFDLLRDGDEYYLVMELIDGSNLAHLVEEKGALDFAEAAQIIEQAATGLAYAHGRGLVHRDIKPQNVMLTTDRTVKILDFGLVAVMENPDDATDLDSGVPRPAAADPLARMVRLTDGQTILGTLPYMPPERTRHPSTVDARSDLYSLGCTFYFLLTGHAAFTGSTIEDVLSAVRAGRFPNPRAIRPEIPPSLENIVLRLMRSRPEHRFASAKQLARALRSWRLQEQLEGFEAPTDSFTYETSEELGEILLRLRIVSEADWSTATESITLHRAESLPPERRMSERDLVTLLSDTVSYAPDSSSVDSLEIHRNFEALSFVNRRSGGTGGLSSWQRVFVEKGDADLLRLPRHVLTQKVGYGWKGEVFKARNLETDNFEAVRTFSAAALGGLPGDEPDRLQAFIRDAQLIARVDDPLFPKVLSSDTCRNRIIPRMAYLATEFVPGVHVGQFAKTHSWPSPGHRAGWALRLIAGVARGLDVAHRQGLLHLDIQPKCLRFTESGEVKLLDLGVAKMVTPRRLECAAVLVSGQQNFLFGMTPDEQGLMDPLWDARRLVSATPRYMPPEQWIDRANVSPATDVYNLGCVLCYLISEAYPFRGESAIELMRNIISRESWRLPPEIPKRVRWVIDTMLATKPSDRFGTASELAETLERVARSFPVEDEPAIPKQSWWRRTWRRVSSR